MEVFEFPFICFFPLFAVVEFLREVVIISWWRLGLIVSLFCQLFIEPTYTISKAIPNIQTLKLLARHTGFTTTDHRALPNTCIWWKFMDLVCTMSCHRELLSFWHCLEELTWLHLMSGLSASEVTMGLQLLLLRVSSLQIDLRMWSFLFKLLFRLDKSVYLVVEGLQSRSKDDSFFI